MRLDLPLPLTPLTTTSSPSGMSTVTFCKLLSRAPMMEMVLPCHRCWFQSKASSNKHPDLILGLALRFWRSNRYNWCLQLLFSFLKYLKLLLKNIHLKCTIRIHSSTHYGIIIRAIVINLHLRLLSLDFNPIDGTSFMICWRRFFVLWFQSDVQTALIILRFSWRNVFVMCCC